jgi:hypothetical protein
MYDGTMAISAAAVRPAPVPFTSFVSRYVAQAAKAENTGAVKTHTVSTDSGMFIAFTNLHKEGI